MKINKSNTTFSSIVAIGERIKKVSKETGEKYLPLNRGLNAVVNIDLESVIELIDFNSSMLQAYAPNSGTESLKKNIAKEYFPNSSNIESSISIINGGMNGLDFIMQILDSKKVYFPRFYWGSYSKMATIRNKSFDFYKSLSDFDLSELNEDSCVFICSPSNPTGQDIEADFLLEMIKKISATGAIIVFDSPYRKLFYNDNFFEKILHENVIICESFSKWIGLSGLRLGFLCSLNKEFNEELNIRMLYELNGISTVSQILVEKLLSTSDGRQAIDNFQRETVLHIKRNIEYLRDNNLLVDSIYGENNDPIGIFAVINKSEDFLFKNKIGAVGMDKFVYSDKEHWSQFSRICVSVRHEQFVKFINNII